MARNTNPARAVVELVREHDGHVCVLCGSPQSLTTQHRVARGMGGSRDPKINQPANLITLCGSGTTGCHGWVERHPRTSRNQGYSVPRWADPEDVPVWTGSHGWQLLDNDGGMRPFEDAAVPS